MRYSLWLLSFLFLFVSSCISEPSNTNTSPPATPEIPEEVGKLNLKCEPNTNTENRLAYDVYLYVGDKKSRISATKFCEPIDKVNYAAYNIPENALMALGGNSEKISCYYYMTLEKDIPTVWQIYKETYKRTPDKYQIRAIAEYKNNRFGLIRGND